jgi:SNF2 family DNA or RNA helicase
MTVSIHRPSQSLILPIGLKSFLTDLPHREITADGKQFVAVNHNLESYAALKDCGVEVPHPMIHYTMPLIGGRWKPFDHQLKTIEFFTLHKRCICLNEMGLGKSASALIAADYLMSIGAVHKVLILSPLSTLECVWANEIFHTLPNRTYSVIHGTAAKRRELLSYNTDFAILNHDGLGVVFDELVADKMIDLLIVDESSVYRNGGTSRYKMLKSFLQPRHRFWAMSGSPTPTAPTDAWSISRIINPNNNEFKYFGAFRNKTMVQITPFKWVARKGAEHIVKQALTPSIRFKKSECLDLPPQIFERREAALTVEQTRVFNAMRSKMEAEIDGEKLTAVNAAAKFGVLRQILGGCYKVSGEEAEYKEIDCQPRINALLEAIDESEAKVIVFVSYTGMLHMVASAIAKHHTVKIIEGETSSSERNDIIRDFQTAENPRVIVASDRCISHGVTLTEADTVIWFCPTTSADSFAQSNARVDRPGQTRTTTVVLIGAHKFEWAMYDALKDKLDMQQVVLDLMGELNLT